MESGNRSRGAKSVSLHVVVGTGALDSELVIGGLFKIWKEKISGGGGYSVTTTFIIYDQQIKHLELNDEQTNAIDKRCGPLM